MNEKIYIVEDESDIADLLKLHLEKSGYQAKAFSEASGFFKKIEVEKPDLVILDLMLPDMDGLEVCKNLRSNAKTSGIPIIMLSAKAEETDRILGLELGADDYVTKPFSPREMISRIKAILRRAVRSESTSIIKVANAIEIDLDKHTVLVHGNRVELTSSEFRILTILAEKPGWVFSREKILDKVWGYEKAVVDRTVDVHIRHLREKLGPAADYIKNIRGAGYKIDD
ncbi:MAG: response regulator transcription factor [Leptospirales bacterium]